MRKGFLIVMAVVLVAAMAAPAMAEFSTSRVRPDQGACRAELQDGGRGGRAGRTRSSSRGGCQHGFLRGAAAAVRPQLEGRERGRHRDLRDRLRNWGDSAYTVGRNQGAGLEADSINLETKNFYLWFNIPNTSMKVTAGLQNQTDSFGGIIFGYADMAGLFLTGNMDPVTFKLGWAKFQEGATLRDDDVDLYVAEAKFSPVKEARLGVDFYVLRDASGSNATASRGGHVQHEPEHHRTDLLRLRGGGDRLHV